MAYVPLPQNQTLNLSPGFYQTRLICDCCGKVRTYGEAMQAGWTYNPQGPAFKAFRCGVCTTQPEAV